MINWLAVIGVATSLIALCLMALVVGLALAAWKSYKKVSELMDQLQRVLGRVEDRLDKIEAFTGAVQRKAKAVVSPFSNVIRRVVQTVRKGLHVAFHRDKNKEANNARNYRTGRDYSGYPPGPPGGDGSAEDGTGEEWDEKWPEWYEGWHREWHGDRGRGPRVRPRG